jgi:hypothetical protein
MCLSPYCPANIPQLNNFRVRVSLRQAVYRQSVRLGDKPLEATTRIVIFQLNTCGHSPYVTCSPTRGWTYRLQLLLGLASAVILRSKSRGTHDHILLSTYNLLQLVCLHLDTDRVENTVSNSSSVVCGFLAVGTCFFAKALLSNGCVYLLINNLLPSSGRCFVGVAVITYKRVSTCCSIINIRIIDTIHRIWRLLVRSWPAA